MLCGGGGKQTGSVDALVRDPRPAASSSISRADVGGGGGGASFGGPPVGAAGLLLLEIGSPTSCIDSLGSADAAATEPLVDIAIEFLGVGGIRGEATLVDTLSSAWSDQEDSAFA